MKIFSINTFFYFLFLIIWPSAAYAEGLKFGVLIPLTGKSARYGQFIKEGLELAQSELAKSGDKVELIFEDDQCLPALGVTATNKLITVDKVNAIYGGFCSTVVLAEAPIAEKAKTLVMASAISPKIHNAGDYIFRMQPDASLYVKKFVSFIFEKRHLKSWAVLAHESDFGMGSRDLFVSEIEKSGGEVVFSDTYLPDTNDFRTLLSRIASKQPDGLFLPGYTETGLIMKQARELGFKGQFAGLTTFENPDVLKNSGAAIEGALFTVHFDPDSENSNVLKYQSLYNGRYGHNSEQFAVLAYEGLLALNKVFKKCKAETECAKKMLYETSFDGVAEKFSFDSFGDPQRSIFIREVHLDGFKTLQ